MFLDAFFFLLIAGVLVGTPLLLVAYGVYVALRYGVRGQPTDDVDAVTDFRPRIQGETVSDRRAA